MKKKIEDCIFSHTRKVMGDDIFIAFYDVTTLYFESESEDDLKRVGFSKEGKLARPQIQLGLFTTLDGYPLAYEVFQGNKYEGHTLIEILEYFQQRFKIEQKPIVVADRGMLTKENIAYLKKNGYRYIIAARIRTLPDAIKKQIINLPFVNDGTIHTIELEQENPKCKQRLILTFSSQRAKKDSYNREKALNKLQIKLTNNPNLTKSDLKRSSYAKFLKLNDRECRISFSLDEKMIQEDKKFDGIKGFITNDFSLSPNQVISHYQNIYTIEKAFRISKTDLKVRPIYHRLEHRIKAHILIAFVSYAIYKEFERRIKQSNLDIKFKLTFDYIKTMYGYKTLFGVEPLELDSFQQKIYDAVYSF